MVVGFAPGDEPHNENTMRIYLTLVKPYGGLHLRVLRGWCRGVVEPFILAYITFYFIIIIMLMLRTLSPPIR